MDKEAIKRTGAHAFLVITWLIIIMLVLIQLF